MEFGATGARELEVSLTKLPIGDYSLVIGDTARGTISVAAGVEGNRGKIKFNTHPDAEDGEALLDFIVAGQPIAITQGVATIFFGELPTSPTPH